VGGEAVGSSLEATADNRDGDDRCAACHRLDRKAGATLVRRQSWQLRDKQDNHEEEVDWRDDDEERSSRAPAACQICQEAVGPEADAALTNARALQTGSGRLHEPRMLWDLAAVDHHGDSKLGAGAADVLGFARASAIARSGACTRWISRPRSSACMPPASHGHSGQGAPAALAAAALIVVMLCSNKQCRWRPVLQL
jgi:hypothetical protein